MGRGKLPVSESDVTAVEELGRQVAEAIARGEFHVAPALMEEAIRMRATLAPSSGGDPSAGPAE